MLPSIPCVLIAPHIFYDEKIKRRKSRKGMDQGEKQTVRILRNLVRAV